MGGFYDSVHVRTKSYDLVREILTKLAKGTGDKFYLAPVIDGWVGLFPSNYWQESIARGISKQANTDVLQMMVYDDDIFRYLYYRGGELIDEYNSQPDYFGEEVPAKERKRLKGRPEVFRELVGSKAKVNKIRKILKCPSFLDKIHVPDEIKEIDKKFKSLSRSIKNFTNDPNAMLEFLEKNPEFFKDETKSLAKEAASRNLKSTEEIQEFLEKSGKTQDMAMKLVEEFVKSRTSSEEFDFLRLGSNKLDKSYDDMEKQISEQIVVGDKGNIKSPEGLFASDSMFQLAEILGIPNVVASYEYLKAGETDGIKEWDKFVEIP